MQLKQSKRQNVKLRLGISGASGFGKTYSALQLAYGLTGDWTRIAVIDTENSSVSLYSNLGTFNVLDLYSPYSPERYIEAIETCERAKMEVVIIDSITHEWSGAGGCLQIQEQLGGRFQDWAKVTPRHQAFIDKILSANCHIITTTRRKVDYSLDMGSNGRAKVVKHGTKEITREGFEYELTVNFEIVNDQHLAKVSKDRTGLFTGKPEFVINSATGKKLLQWCNIEPLSLKSIDARIQECLSVSKLMELYKHHPNFQKSHQAQFQQKKVELEKLSNPNNFSKNGTSVNTQ
ncbi:AAA family ATPase [Maribacter dokdonensis]|uniref:AAA family ATPase n=1 Tax=Maribacter dokdonensis TaxID=320912 RepID=UPI00273471F4|nr:AAA family ATPase [Maribacter dokdonensis]MDP2526484.1 AAA family ATPase [Maribacter dokdonensis]